jgi:riboflavin biosynthesis pyrimidine reductase
MRALLPEQAEDVDLETAYALPEQRPDRRPFVRINMISSLDGAIAFRGKSGVLGGPADRRVFETLRGLADVIVVGAGTIRAEGYGPARLPDEAKDRRQARGQTPVPSIAVVTRSCHLDWTSPFFTEAEVRPMVMTTSGVDDAAYARARDAADVLLAGDDQVDLAGAFGQLEERGTDSVLVEGGPRLNAQLAAADLMDELCLTLSPRLVCGDGPRVLAGAELASPIELRTAHLMEEDGFYFLRLVRSPA